MQQTGTRGLFEASNAPCLLCVEIPTAICHLYAFILRNEEKGQQPAKLLLLIIW